MNNVLCFPYIFRGALDCGATRITAEMKLACVRQIADLAKEEVSEEVASAYAGQELAFGRDYIIPKPFDSRLILRIAPAVAAAAAASGVATRPIADLDAYRQRLMQMFAAGGLVMQPVFTAARASRKRRIVYGEGEDVRALRAAQFALDDGLAEPILIGRPAVVEQRIAKAGLRLRPGHNIVLINPDDDPRFKQYWQAYHHLMGRRGISPEAAKNAVRRSTTTIAAMMVKLGDADAMLCGLHGRFDAHLAKISDVIGTRADAPCLATLNGLMLEGRTLFIADTYVNEVPSAQLLAQIALQATQEVHLFGLTPKVAFLSHSNYGSSRRESATRMREAYEIFSRLAPHVECDGEMHADAALSATIRSGNLMDSRLKGEANILICPNLDAANILFNTIKVLSRDGSTIGPILMGSAAPAHADALLDRAPHPVHDSTGRRAGCAPPSPSPASRGVRLNRRRLVGRVQNQLVEPQVQPAAELVGCLADGSLSR